MQPLALAWVLFACGAGFHVIAAWLKPGYAWMKQYLRELDASGTVYATQFGYFGFAPMAILFSACLIAPWKALPATRRIRIGLLLWSQPLDLLMTVVAPCARGCPDAGSLAQGLHNALGCCPRWQQQAR